MAKFSLGNVRIAGISACVPRHSVSNWDYDWISERERKLLVRTTGIQNRRVAQAHQCVSDLCVAAAERLLTELAWDKSEIEVLILVSQTPDHLMPATSIMVQDRMGLPKSCMALDINLGCSAYVYGLSVISGLLGNSGLKKGLLLVGDVITKTLSLQDKSTSPIFADAGSATALEFAPDAPPIHFNLQSNGAGAEAIMVKEGGMRNPITYKSLEVIEHAPGICRAGNQMGMDGLQVFNFALREVKPNVEALLAYIQKEKTDFDYFVFHQANLLLNESIRRKLKLPKEKVPYALAEFGNTSAATIPLVMVSRLGEVLQSRPLSLILSGFGVGLSWGSVALSVDKIICPPLIELE